MLVRLCMALVSCLKGTSTTHRKESKRRETKEKQKWGGKKTRNTLELCTRERVWRQTDRGETETYFHLAITHYNLLLVSELWLNGGALYNWAPANSESQSDICLIGLTLPEFQILFLCPHFNQLWQHGLVLFPPWECGVCMCVCVWSWSRLL